ncbi:hypothetical protein CY34DRAFT_800051 [Suillus luteus UH-Slu-Lm8-n1]|uniref:Uncharacterized protein n=1 Tax=Suillus luteus UH-Slu-Lm8-n1 TaxID=930992 RepID=A0A0D0BUK2_9AGAM|nr:hypothetical protein CY34DRAFT_800051 [Suillus luteus UH-Slu-Lm8-n1]
MIFHLLNSIGGLSGPISSIRANNINGIVEFAVCDVIYPIRLGMHMARFISMGALMASRRSPVMHSKVTSGDINSPAKKCDIP